MKTKKNFLPIILVPINKGQYISDIPAFYPLPNNAIFHKTLPNIGATTGEILADRNSIIIEPNVPVIKGKAKKHPFIIQAVHKGIFKDDLIEYLESMIMPKKIICTPEAYHKKVKPVIDEWGKMDLYKDFTMLLDECDKIITDVDYRSAITAPMEDFFKFHSKLMLSATALTPTHPGFLTAGFTYYNVVPQFDYSQQLKLICTNNVVAAMRQYLKEVPARPVFAFVNSTDTILSIINTLGIKRSSKVFCGEDSVTKLNNLGFRNADSELTTFADFNFLTSRFFSAVDIDLTYKANIILITDIFFAKHSILDPATDVIQISGRFRNGVSSITHITNTDSEITFMNADEVETYLSGSHDLYKQFMDYLKTGGLNQGAQDMLTQALERVDYARFVTRDGEVNYFMKDNFINEERVKGYYKSPPELMAAYAGLKHFNVEFDHQTYPIGDDDRLKRTRSREQKEYFQLIAEQLEKLNRPIPAGTYRFDNRQDEIAELRQACPEICEAYNLIGLNGLQEAGFRRRGIKKAVRAQKRINAVEKALMLDAIYESFTTNRPYSEEVIIDRLGDIYQEFETGFTPKASHITRYFSARRTTQKDGGKAYFLEVRKFRTKTEIDNDKQ